MQLKTKSGITTFSANVAVRHTDLEIRVENGVYAAFKKGKLVGDIVGNKVYVGEDNDNVQLSELIPSVDMDALLAKNPVDLSKDELVLLANHLKSAVGTKTGLDTTTEEKPAKAAKKAEVASAPASTILTAEQLKALGAKKLWKEVIQPIAEQLEGVSSRSKMDEMIEAYLKFHGVEQEEDGEDEEEEVEVKKEKTFPDKGKKGKAAPAVEEEEDEEEDEDAEDEDDSDDEEEDDEESESDDDDDDADSDDDSDEEDEEEDDEDSEDEEDDSDEDDDESDDSDDEEDADDDEEEDDEDEEDNVPVIKKAADVDALTAREDIQAVIKANNIKLPKGEKLNVMQVKEIIKKQLFGKKGKK